MIGKWGAKIRKQLLTREPGRGLDAYGTVHVRFEVAKSSGNAELGQAMVQGLWEAAPFPAAPRFLKLDTHRFALPIQKREPVAQEQ